MANELRGVAPSGTLYARIINGAGLWWNGSTFETYSAGNYSDYDIAMSEQGNSSLYVGDFPTGITTSGTYEYYVHRQAGGSPAEGDIIVNTGKVDWSGTSSVTVTSGAMTGSDWRDYILRLGFKRTDKDTEIYEATTDAIQEMRRRFMFDEAESDISTTDTISVLGDFQLDVESDFGLLLDIIVQDGTTAFRLKHRSKEKFDEMYPDIHVTNNKGFPTDFCIYAGQIYIGPVPDSTDYTYRKNYSQRAGTVTSSTTGVPFTNLYRDVLADNVMSRLYKGLEEFDNAAGYREEFENGFLLATRRELINSGSHSFTQKAVDC